MWLTSANQYCQCFVYSSSNPVCIILSLWSQFCARVDLFSRTDHSHLFIFIRLFLTKTAKEASIAETFDLEISTWSTASYVNVCHSQSLFSAQTITTHLLCKLLWRQCNFAAWYKCVLHLYWNKEFSVIWVGERQRINIAFTCIGRALVSLMNCLCLPVDGKYTYMNVYRLICQNRK